MVERADAERWLEQWRGATVALAAQRKRELQTLSAEQALAASEALLSLADPQRLSLARRTHSGLVEQQALFHQRLR